MNRARARRVWVVLVLAVVGLAACESAGPAGSPEAAIPPSGPSAQTVEYVCADGDGSILVDIPDLERIGDVLNPIDVCEFDGGVETIVFEVVCTAAARRVTVQAIDGDVPNQSLDQLCA